MTNSLRADFEAQGLELVETHTAWVFRGPELVWKVKKPVDYGFLDYSTVEKRHAACEAELRLNARLAPDVYRAVVPVRRGSDGRHGIDVEGEVVDWAVEMRRLDDADRADLWLAAGTLTPAHVESIAEYLAAFHEKMPSTSEIAEYGRPSKILENVRENFTQAGTFAEAILTPEEAREIEVEQIRFFEQHDDLLQRRIENGKIRDGHGDLRLEHVYFAKDGPPAIIDCIEFNDRFRYADVCADVAFLSMDLERLGRADLAELFLAAYARATCDYDLYALVDTYEGYRAYVRGKVASFLSEDADATFEHRERARHDARQAFLLALSEGRAALVSPAVIAVGGVIASGKSTMARRIAEMTSAPIIGADRTRKHLHGVAPTTQLCEAAYSAESTERVYDEVFRRAALVLDSGRTAILDASFRTRGARGRARALARERGLAFHFVECRASREVSEARLRARAEGPSVSDARECLLDDFIASWESAEDLPDTERLVVDTTLPFHAVATLLRQRLPVWPGGFTG